MRIGYSGIVAIAVTVWAGCDSTDTMSSAREGSERTGSHGETDVLPTQEPLAAERVEIPGGKFLVGSKPGSAGRRPQIEPALYEVELGPFQIDRLPFPNDPKLPPRVNVTRAEAEGLCAERGARLCTELEWERACKGPKSDTYSGGNEWSPRCAREPMRCTSGYNVLAMGAALREWTSSDVIPVDKGRDRNAAVRAAAASAPGPEHRCARREAVDSSEKSDSLGFRCCGGAPNGAVIREPALGATFEKPRLSAGRLEKLLSSHPRTRELAKDIQMFRDPDAAETVIARGPGNRKGFKFTVSPLVWNPVAGARYLLVAARSGEKTSFVLAYHIVGKDEYSLLASFIMRDEPGPVAFAYSEYIRPRLHFSTCWGCPGETGKILFREPDSVAILQP